MVGIMSSRESRRASYGMWLLTPKYLIARVSASVRAGVCSLSLCYSERTVMRWMGGR